MDPKLIEILQNPPRTPMTGTLIAPLAMLYNFFELKAHGNGAAAVEYLSKLFRLSSMPRQYIALLIAELLPIFDGNCHFFAWIIGIEKRKMTIDKKDLFEILAAVEDYSANEVTFNKGADLLSQALQIKTAQIGPIFRNWRDLIPMESAPKDIIGLFRIKVTHIIAHLYITN
jgi:Nup85 Nucleoporin